MELARILEMGLFLKILVFFSIIRSTQGYHDNLKFPFMQTAANLAHKPLTKHYDYIIVGGGTAGCPLAATLSRNFSVLLLERGGSPFGNPYVAWMRNFHISLANAEPGSAAETFISTDGVINSRARVLGGGTCINAGFYTRASTDFVSRAGWDGALVNASYPWVERQIVHKPTLVPWQMAVKDGLLNAGVSPYNGFTYDHLYGTKAGGTIFNRRGFRNTAADLLGSANPKKIDVVIRATVKRVIFNTKGRRPNAVGVIFTDDSGREHKALLNQRRESNVIVSAGALGSPQLMMLSGIGPKEVLKKWKIPLVMDQKEVGQGMSDNPMNSVFIPTKKEMAQSLIQIVGITKVGSYIEASSGFGSTNDSIHDCHHGIMSAEIGQLSTIPPKKRSLDAIRQYRKRKSSLPKELFKGAFILEKVEGPLSVGNLTLNSADVHVTPAVTFNYFQHPDDLRRCVEGIRTIEHVAKSQHVVNLAEDDEYTLQMLLNLTVKANINFIPKNTNDTSSLEQFCKDTVLTIWHYHGGCQVDRVVDKDYRVLGAERIRVIDGSTFKSSPGTNPQATVMMLGRYVGVKILRERLGRRAGV